MNKTPLLAPAARWLLRALLPVLMVAGAHAANTDIATAPLYTSAPSTVLPNLMFVIDDSGSMDWDYMPDYVNEGFCRASGAVSTTTTNSGTFNRGCCQNASNNDSGSNSCWRGAAPFGEWRGHPPFLANSFNGLAYNPAVRYQPPLKADGTQWANQDSGTTVGWTLVKNDAYNIQNTESINLLTQFPDTEWCTDGTFTDCLRNGNYVLPGSVNGKAYTTFRAVTATGSGQITLGQPDAATTEDRSFGPHYYTITPYEWCDGPNLRNCQAGAGGAFTYPAPVRWCSSDANSRAATPAAGSCQAIRTATYSNARYPTKFFTPVVPAKPAVDAVAASTTFTLQLSGTCNNSNKIAFAQLLVNGVDLFGGTGTATERRQNELSGFIRDRINANTATTGYSASGNTNSIKITAPVSSGAITHTVSLVRTTTSAASCISATSPIAPAFSGYVAYKPAEPLVPAAFPGSFARVDIIPSVTSYPKAAARADCAGSSCTYAEEMTNFANWWTYYHSRMQTMKSGTSNAFAPVSDQYRLGYISINNATGNDFLNLGTFTGTQKDDWFKKLVAARPNGATPLRGALSKVGRLYGGALNGSSLNGSTVKDPMQFSCQQNFTLLSTDGYWNESAIPKQLDGTTDIGDQDGAPETRPRLDGNSTINTLADVAAYYYKTDLRTANCTAGSGADLCENNVPTGGQDTATHQHMTTFTLGLGISGYMQFQSNYRTATSGDFFDVKEGTAANPTAGVCSWQTTGACNWSTPVNNSQPNIDDLWHAAVNGRGTYFSASDPVGLYSGLSGALAQIETQKGAAAAATTSNPNVSAGDNFVFISRFLSQEWTGELVGQQINVDTGQIEAGISWSAQAKLDANTSRSIYTFDGTAVDGLKSFAWANLSTAEQAYFQLSHMTAAGPLTQFCLVGPTCLDSTAQASAAGEPLLNFLRGTRTDEGPLTDPTKYFRQRANLLGDIVNSEAVYVKKALLDYADAGYAAHKTAVADRQSMVYVGANDGMLHAFNAETGDEMWAFVPTAVMPRLYRLADKNYANRHQFYVDSSPVAGDAYIGGAWRTLLVGGLGAGGRAYYALDVTDPASPKALWQFSTPNLGLTFGKPEITKLKDGTWVVILASGYNNNVGGGDGVGRLFVLDAATGTLIRTISTGAGSATTPSGLAHIRAWADKPEIDNTALRVYGGDNDGNLWRFDVNGDVGATGYDAQRLATLQGGTGNAQPITARPELGDVSGKAMIYVGTGRYLGVSDLSDSSEQTIYAIKDDLGTTDYGSPRSEGSFVEQTLSSGTCPAGASICAEGEAVRAGTSNAVNLASDSGWFIDLPEGYERANTDPQLALGTLVFTTNVVKPGACSAGGRSYINYFDYRTGGPVSTASGFVSGFLGEALATRPALVRLPNGKVVSLTRLSDDRTVTKQVPVGPTVSATRRISWRELATEQ